MGFHCLSEGRLCKTIFCGICSLATYDKLSVRFLRFCLNNLTISADCIMRDHRRGPYSVYWPFDHSHMYVISVTLSPVCLMTGPQPLSRLVLHRVWSSASSLNFYYPLVILRSSSSCLRLLPRLPVNYFFYLSTNNVF